MLFPPQLNEWRRQIAVESLQPVYGRMAGGAERRQPGEVVAPRSSVMHNIGRRAAHPAAAAIPLQDVFFAASEMGFRMAGRIVAATAQTQTAQFFARADEAA